MNKQQNYTGSDIKILNDIDAIRKYPGMYIGDVTCPNHLFYEVINNSVDEAMMGFCNTIVIEFLDHNRILIRDNGRGIPIDMHASGLLTCQIVFMKNHSGGKFDTNIYSKSGGLHGIGLVAVNALCSTLIVSIRRANSICYMRFTKGQCEECNTTEVPPAIESNYTEIILEPDSTIFDSSSFNIQDIMRRLYHIAALNKTLTIKVTNHIDNTAVDINIQDGIVFLLEQKISTKIIKSNIRLDDTVQSIDIETFFNWCASTKEEDITAFTNCIIQPDGGTHVQGLKSGITKFFSELYEIQNVTYKDVLWQDLKQGFKAVINIKLQNPKFNSQAKQKLVSHDVRKAMEKVVYRKLQRIYKEQPNMLQDIIHRTIKILIAKQGDDNSKSNISALMYNGKLTDCTTKDRDDAELYIAEGESAGGTIKPVLDRTYQAVLSIRGKILNVEKANTKQILASEILTIITKAIGGAFDISGNTTFTEIRYGKVIILVDADIDGSHIRSLLLTLFYRNMFELIAQHRLYIAVPPLYSIKTKHDNKYLQKQEELNMFIYNNIFAAKLHDINLNKTQAKVIKEIIELLYKGYIQNEFEAIITDVMIQHNVHTFVELFDNFNNIQKYVKATRHEIACYLNNNNHIVLENFYTMTKCVFDEKNVTNVYNKIVYSLLTFYPDEIVQIHKKIYAQYTNGVICTLYKYVTKIDEEIDIQRFKGLGEMNQDQIYNTVINPKTRIIKRVTLNMVKEADNLCTILMGNDARNRREFIINNYNQQYVNIQ